MIARGLATFAGLKHRMEEVGRRGRVEPREHRVDTVRTREADQVVAIELGGRPVERLGPDRRRLDHPGPERAQRRG